MTLIKSISGIRGTIGGRTGDTLNPLDIVKFTSAYATFIARTGKTNKIVVGRDARISGEMVANVVCGTLMGMGYDVIDIGLATTPTTELAGDEYRQMSLFEEPQNREKQKKVDELNRKIDDIVRKQTEKASKTSLTKEQKLIAGGFEANKGRLPWPVEKGMISGHFGKQQHPVYSQVTMDNKGIYLQTTAGTKARAVYKGEVTSCFMVGGTYAVIVQHGNYRTVYSNLSKLSVKQGDKVDTKQAIGTIFTDPEQDQKTELYFQIYKDKNIQNPELWIAK